MSFDVYLEYIYRVA